VISGKNFFACLGHVVFCGLFIEYFGVCDRFGYVGGGGFVLVLRSQMRYVSRRLCVSLVVGYYYDGIGVYDTLYFNSLIKYGGVGFEPTFTSTI